MDTLDRGMTHIPGRTEQNSKRFHHITQNGLQFKTYNLFIFGIFYSIIFRPQLTNVIQIAESKTADERDNCKILTMLLQMFMSVFSKLSTLIIYIPSISRKIIFLSETERDSTGQCEKLERKPLHLLW